LPAHVPQHATISPISKAKLAFANGDVARAEQICAQVLARQPNEAGAWALLTETALQRGRPDAAIVCANRAIASSPKDPVAVILRAKCLLICGEAGQALAAAEAAAQLVSDDAPALDALGAIFGLLGLHQRAKPCLLRAVEARPDVPQYLFNLAATERMTGALMAAEAHCDAAIAHDRHYGLAHYLRSDLRVQTVDRNHIAEMEALLLGAKLALPSRIMLRFALAKEYEDLERHDRAFDHVNAGCELQRRAIDYDAKAEIAEIDRIIATHTRRWLDAAPPGHTAATPVFVVGLPRTGTTLVERIIASHPMMRSVGETNAFAAALQRTLREQPSGQDVPGIGRRYIEAVNAFETQPGGRFVDKTLQNYLYCGLIHAALPRARIILVQRHPLDACFAILKAHFQGKFPFAYDQVELAEYYLAYRRLSRHWRTVLPSDVLMEISYEAIVSDQTTASQRLTDFVGLEWNDEVLRFHESTAPSATASAVQVRRPIYSTSVGKWRHHAERLAPLRARLAREIPDAELA
jgi:tetratricopeptide (TPR) repeat protein